MALNAPIATFPPSYYIRRARVVLDRLKRNRMQPYALPTLQEVTDALESLDTLEAMLKTVNPNTERK